MRWSVSRALVIAAATLLLGSGVAAGPAAATPPDQVVTFVNIHDGDVVSADGAPLNVLASQGAGIASSWLYVRYFIDGTQMGPADICGSPSTLTCSSTSYWSTAGLSGTHTLQAKAAYEEFGVPAGEVVSPVITVTVSAERPTVTITSPTPSQVVSGLVEVDVVGVIPADLVDTATRIRFYPSGELGGLPAATVECAGQPDDHRCEATFNWDTSQMISPTWPLRAAFDTSHGNATSDPVSVTVSNPPVTATMNSPAPGPVSGIVEVSATATIPAVLTSTADEFSLYVSGAFIGRQTCAGQPSDHVCTATIPWDTRSLPPGTYSVLMVFQFNGVLGAGRVAPDPVEVTVPAATRLSLTVPPARSGTPASGSGRLTTVSAGTALAGVPITMTVKPVVGGTRTLKTTTDKDGRFRWTWPATTNAAITVVAAGSATSAPTTATAKAAVSAPLVCTWTKKVVRGRSATGRCTAAGLPAGTRYTLQQRSGTAWRTAARGVSVKGGFAFARVMPTRGTVTLRAQLPATKLWTFTTGPAMRVTVT